MAVVTTNLGTITAYGDAVAAGYTGTKAQWQALMANYATVGQQAAQDAQTASQAAQTATTKAGEASKSATAARSTSVYSRIHRSQIGHRARRSACGLKSSMRRKILRLSLHGNSPTAQIRTARATK